MASTRPPARGKGLSSAQDQLSRQQTLPMAAVSPTGQSASWPLSNPDSQNLPTAPPPVTSNKRRYTRLIAVTLVLILAVTLYVIWHAAPTSPTVSLTTTSNSQQNGASTPSTLSTATTDTIKVYVVGAVKHPGVYSLPADARVYDLLQAAGGPLPNANLVALNLAAKLTDGQEVYVAAIGETPPALAGSGTGTPSSTSTDQLVNINTASVDEMRLKLHISSVTAQNIVNYRTQHGPFTSIDQLLAVISKSIYDKIKGQITV